MLFFLANIHVVVDVHCWPYEVSLDVVEPAGGVLVRRGLIIEVKSNTRVIVVTYVSAFTQTHDAAARSPVAHVFVRVGLEAVHTTAFTHISRSSSRHQHHSGVVFTHLSRLS